MMSDDSYFEYLKSRSAAGLFYRRFWLYPRLCRHLSGRLLDVGCGLGDMLAFRPDSVGVDINPRTVEWCRTRGLDARLMRRNELPFESGAFSSILLDNVLEHLSDPEPLLEEIRRVLVDGGRLVVGVPGLRGYKADPDHKRYYSETELIKKLEEFHFNCKRLFYMPIKWKWLNNSVRQYCVYGVFDLITTKDI